jgi:hydroxylysine kinase
MRSNLVEMRIDRTVHRMTNRSDPTGSPDPLAAISTRAPRFAAKEIHDLLLEQYGLEGELQDLVSERDQNIRVRTVSGERFVMKIANTTEDPVVTDFQIKALLHIQSANCDVRIPEIVTTLDGAVATKINDGEVMHIVRLVTYLPGIPVADVSSSVELAGSLGDCLAHLDLALCNFEHPGDRQVLLWDMQRASQMRSLIAHVTEPELRAAVTQCLDDFEADALPVFSQLRSQVAHNDLNPGNALVCSSDHSLVTGVIDFGDMVRAPLVVDVAIAASYLRSYADPLVFIAPFIAAYHRVMPLQEVERQLLYDLIRTRLITTIIILRWRLSERGENDAYSQEALASERGAEKFLMRLSSLAKGRFMDAIDRACGC